MVPRLTSSAHFAGERVGAWVLLAAATPLLMLPALAHAQPADAGAEQRAVAPPPAPPPRVLPGDLPATNEPSGVLPKVINPAQLSEATRARLAERTAGQHASSIPVPAAGLRAEQEPAAGGIPATVPPVRPRAGASEPPRRGPARPRVQAVETREGVTLLSNRIQMAEPRLTAALAKRPLPRPSPETPFADQPIAADDVTEVTETHSLRPMASRSTRARDAGTSLGWLLWPFVLFVSAGAVVGTLWFRNKTE